jgi:hypothetical protein
MPSFKHFFGNQRVTSLKFAGQQTSVKGFIAQVVGWFGHKELSPKLEQSSPCLKLTRVSRVSDAARTRNISKSASNPPMIVPVMSIRSLAGNADDIPAQINPFARTWLIAFARLPGMGLRLGFGKEAALHPLAASFW